MAQLIVRRLDEEVVRRLKVRAGQHGVSAEAEHRAILEHALRPADKGKGFKELLASIPDVGTDEDFARPLDYGREVDF